MHGTRLSPSPPYMAVILHQLEGWDSLEIILLTQILQALRELIAGTACSNVTSNP